ncbi:MAG TPA: hypothetical protein VM122_05175, partial [Usitatibacter sp.]|nr:hypothetical protein [Usitatibacter sp.]
MIARVLAILSMLAALGVQAQNYQGLWWKSPGGSEAGWGLNIAHQGDVLFVTWHTYEADGHALWLTMSDARPSSAGVYAGTLYQTKGLATNTGYWDDPPWAVTKPVGSGILAFTSA